MKHPLYISIMGTMGSGKTTASRLIAKKFGMNLVEENFGDNAFLPRFYTHMDRWAFHSQTFFLMEKITQLMEISASLSHPTPSVRRGIVQDTPLEQDVFSYAKAQHVLGNMDDAEWKLYQKIYSSFKPHLPEPDYIVYLETSIPVVARRIESRGRKFEQSIPLTYISLLEKLNNEWIHMIPKKRCIRIQTDQLNIVTSALAKAKFLSYIQEKIVQKQ